MRHELKIQWPHDALHASELTQVRQFAGWFVLGLVAIGAEVALLAVLYQRLRCPLWLASAVVAEALIIGRFMLMDRLVFGHQRPALPRLWRYQGACLGAFLVSWAILNGTALAFGFPVPFAVLAGTAGAFGWSLATNFLWVWRP